MAMPRITVRVPKPVKKAGKQRAEELGHPNFSAYVRDLIREDVGNEAIMAHRRRRKLDLFESDGGKGE